MAILTERVTAAERLASKSKRGEQQAQRKMESMVQVVPDEKRKFATHTWLSVARILGIDGADLSRIAKASKHMHDTVSSDWNESLSRHSEMTIRLRSAGKIILTRLFSCVRVNKTTVPVNEVLGVICFDDENYSNGNDKTLQEIRKAVQSAIAERRISDAKMLLTLSIASFSGNENGTGKCIESMKRYFTSIKPIVVGSKVTFLNPDDSPIKSKKKIKCHNYSYDSKFVTRGTAVAVNHRKNELKVRHYVPGVEKEVVSKVPMQQAINSANIYVNRKLLVSAMQWKSHLGVGVSPVQTPSVQNHVITLKVTTRGVGYVLICVKRGGDVCERRGGGVCVRRGGGVCEAGWCVYVRGEVVVLVLVVVCNQIYVFTHTGLGQLYRLDIFAVEN
ncbi:MAG: hypothetical protein CMH49_04945 [Myxococcales bacterium]|nr:hypothetical protein [Myxococcales bacterium]